MYDAALHSNGTQLVYIVHKTLSFVQKWLGLACETRIDITIKGLKFVCWVGQGLTRSDLATPAKRKGFYELCIQAVSHWNARQHPYIL